MTNNDFMQNNLQEILKQTQVIAFKPITDKEGNIVKIIVEYVPVEVVNKEEDKLDF